MQSELDLFERQGMNYFSGYICKTLKRFHKGACLECDKFCSKITSDTSMVTEDELFTFLKRYDNDSSSLYSPTENFTAYVQKVSLLGDHCLKNHLAENCILASLKKNGRKVSDPGFCSTEMKDKVSGHIMKTLLMYRLKSLNDTLKEEGAKSRKSQRKLRILKST